MNRTLLWIASFLAAAVAPAILMCAFAIVIGAVAGLTGLTGRFAIGILLASALWVVTIGLPLVAILWWRNIFRRWTVTLAGFLATSVPVALLAWPAEPRGSNASGYSDGQWILIDGVPTLAGWLNYVCGVLFYGLLGVVGAMAFWLTWHGLMLSNKRLERP